MSYEIMVGGHTAELEIEVNRALARGLRCVGGVAADAHYMYQAMIDSGAPAAMTANERAALGALLDMQREHDGSSPRTLVAMAARPIELARAVRAESEAAPEPVAAMTANEREALDALLRYEHEDDMGESDDRTSEAHNRMMILARAVRAEREAARAAEAAQHE